MPLYKEQGIVLRSIKLGEADKILTILTQGDASLNLGFGILPLAG